MLSKYDTLEALPLLYNAISLMHCLYAYLISKYYEIQLQSIPFFNFFYINYNIVNLFQIVCILPYCILGNDYTH